jgi:hypothetical protein
MSPRISLECSYQFLLLALMVSNMVIQTTQNVKNCGWQYIGIFELSFYEDSDSIYCVRLSHGCLGAAAEC